MSTPVFTRDLSSGRVHRRYRLPGGKLATYEGCNLDDAGDFQIIPSTEEVEPDHLCRNCFGMASGDDEPEGAA